MVQVNLLGHCISHDRICNFCFQAPARFSSLPNGLSPRHGKVQHVRAISPATFASTGSPAYLHLTAVKHDIATSLLYFEAFVAEPASTLFIYLPHCPSEITLLLLCYWYSALIIGHVSTPQWLHRSRLHHHWTRSESTGQKLSSTPRHRLTCKQGNLWESRDYGPEAPNQNSYRYSNA